MADDLRAETCGHFGVDSPDAVTSLGELSLPTLDRASLLGEHS